MEFLIKGNSDLNIATLKIYLSYGMQKRILRITCYKNNMYYNEGKFKFDDVWLNKTATEEENLFISLSVSNNTCANNVYSVPRSL